MTSTKLLQKAPSTIPEGMQLISFSRKSTAKNPVKDEEKERFCIVPAFGTIAASYNDESSTILAAALAEVIEKTASSILQAAFVADPTIEEVSLDLLSWDAIVAALEAKQTSTSVTGDTIAQWYDASETGKANATRYGTDEKAQAKSKMLRQKYLSLASMNPGIPGDQAARFLSYMVESDLSHPIAATVARRLQQIVAKAVDSNDL